MSFPVAATTDAFCEMSMRLVAFNVELPKSHPRDAPTRLSTCRSMDWTSRFNRPSSFLRSNGPVTRSAPSGLSAWKKLTESVFTAFAGKAAERAVAFHNFVRDFAADELGVEVGGERELERPGASGLK